MGRNLVQKIFEKHLVSGRLTLHEDIAISVDQTLTQDATGTMAYLQFEALGIPRVKTKFSISYVDHNTNQSEINGTGSQILFKKQSGAD